MYRLLQTENLVIIDKLIHEQIIQSSFVNQLNWFTERSDSKEWIIHSLDITPTLMNLC